MTKESIGERLIGRSLGERVTLTTFRRDELREVDITLGQRPHNQVDVPPMATTIGGAAGGV